MFSAEFISKGCLCHFSSLQCLASTFMPSFVTRASCSPFPHFLSTSLQPRTRDWVRLIVRPWIQYSTLQRYIPNDNWTLSLVKFEVPGKDRPLDFLTPRVFFFCCPFFHDFSMFSFSNSAQTGAQSMLTPALLAPALDKMFPLTKGVQIVRTSMMGQVRSVSCPLNNGVWFQLGPCITSYWMNALSILEAVWGHFQGCDVMQD